MESHKIPWFQSTNQSINGTISLGNNGHYSQSISIYINIYIYRYYITILYSQDGHDGHVYGRVYVQLRAAVVVNLKWIM